MPLSLQVNAEADRALWAPGVEEDQAPTHLLVTPSWQKAPRGPEPSEARGPADRRPSRTPAAHGQVSRTPAPRRETPSAGWSSSSAEGADRLRRAQAQARADRRSPTEPAVEAGVRPLARDREDPRPFSVQRQKALAWPARPFAKDCSAPREDRRSSRARQDSSRPRTGRDGAQSRRTRWRATALEAPSTSVAAR